MKVIDLLNKIANGEEVPKKIKCEDMEYTYNEITNDYDDIFDNELFYEVNGQEKSVYDWLNKEVEIIEEDKKIETLDLDWVECFNFKEQAQQDCVKMVFNKINEIIDYLEENK